MSSSHRIITSGTALVLCPKIKQHFGVSAALVLQQLHYWLSKENLSYGIIDEDGYQWIRNSYEQWCEQIQVLTLSTLRRAFSTLIAKNIILSQRFSEKSRYAGGNQVKFYTINYDQLEVIMGDLGKASINRPSHFPMQTYGAGDTSLKTTVHNPQNKRAISHQPSVQKQTENCSKQPNHLLKMNTLPAQNEHPLYITNTTSENTSEKTSLSGTTQKIDRAKLQVIHIETIQPDKPAEREKTNVIEDMISFWNEIIEQTPHKIALTTKRSQHLNAAFKQFFNSNLADWETFCCKIASSKFLMGEVKPFKANLDWAIRFETIQRILEGGYSFGDRESNYKLKLSASCLTVGDETFKTSSKGLISTRVESQKATAIREKIKKKISTAEYASWFLDTEICVEENEYGYDEVILCVSTRFKGDRIQTTYRNIYEHYFSDYFVGTAEQYLKSRNINIVRNDAPMTAPTTEMPSLNECQKSRYASEISVAHHHEEHTQLTVEYDSADTFPIEIREDATEEVSLTIVKDGRVENKKESIPQEDRASHEALMYEELPIVDKANWEISSGKKSINQVQMDTDEKFIHVDEIVDESLSEKKKMTLPQGIFHSTSLNSFKTNETKNKKGREIIKIYGSVASVRSEQVSSQNKLRLDALRHESAKIMKDRAS